MAYSEITFDQLTTALATRLTNPLAAPNGVFWLTAELQSYLLEALRTWQAFSNFTSDEASISTTANVLFYDTFAMIPQLAPTITDQDIIADIERALQEPISLDSWTGTECFTFAGVVQAIQKRRDKFMVETGLVLSLTGDIPGPTPPSGQLTLDDHTINVRRAMWKPSGGVYSILWPDDTFMLTAGSQQWTVPSVPVDFSTFFSTPLTLLLAPPPAVGLDGDVNLITVNSGDNLDPATGPTVLGIPDDLCWIIKFGALADLFGQEGPGQDVARAQYCQSRWEDGIKLARITNYIRLGYITGTPGFVSSMDELDTSNPNWVSSTPGPPVSLAVAGNIVAPSPIPDNAYVLTFQIVPKFPVPVVGGDFIQLGQEFIDPILDYAQHLAQLKIGASSVNDTTPLYQNLVKMAAVENDILRAEANSFDVMSDRTTLDEKERPRRRSDFTLAPQDYVK